MWLVDWLIARWTRVNEVFELWYWRIRDAFENHWAEFWYVVIVWYGQAYRYFREKVNQLEDIVVGWYGRIRGAVYDRWDTLWQALTASWSFIWGNFFEGYRWIIDYTYSARNDIYDTFTRFKYEFQAFRTDPTKYIYDRLPQGVKDLWGYFAPIWSKVTNFFTNLYTTIADFLSRIWSWLWEHFDQWVRDILWWLNYWWGRVTDFFVNLYYQVADFLSRAWSWIYDHIPQVFKDAWNFLIEFLGRLKALVISFWEHLIAFLQDPFGYITRLLQAWIEGWRAYIFGVIGDLLDQLQREIILHILDWMGYVAPPIEAIDEMGPHFSSFTDMFKEWANAWKERKEAWVKEAMVMMEAFAAELRGEEEMDLLTPSETILQYWQMLTPEQIRLIVEPPIKG